MKKTTKNIKKELLDQAEIEIIKNQLETERMNRSKEIEILKKTIYYLCSKNYFRERNKIEIFFYLFTFCHFQVNYV